jgi:hypothetical protein
MNTRGIERGAKGPEELPPSQQVGGVGEGGESGDIGAALHTKVSTLGELKAMLIACLGEEQGKKFYNQFLSSFALLMIQQVQGAAQHAKQSSQNMRTRT